MLQQWFRGKVAAVVPKSRSGFIDADTQLPAGFKQEAVHFDLKLATWYVKVGQRVEFQLRDQWRPSAARLR